MLKSYFKTAWRNLVRNKIYSGINIFGLALGMAACFFIFQHVAFESGYDRFHANAPNIYRVPISYSGSFADNGTFVTNHPALGPALKRDFPEVTDYVRIVSFATFFKSNYMAYEEEGGKGIKTFYETNIYFVDPSFFNVFSFPLVRGDRSTCLKDPNTVVISESVAKKYFGDKDPLNKTLISNGSFPSKVTGVFADPPENSHIKFDILFHFDGWGNNENWTWPEWYTYVLLAPGTDTKKMEAKFPAFIDKYLGNIMKELNFGSSFHLQPLTGIHLTSHFKKEAEINGSEQEVFFLSVIGVFILLIAWTNYINLSTAKSMERAKEVGIRKVSGAMKKQLMIQFLLESFIINVMALFVTVIIIFFTLPWFNRLVGKNISEGFFTQGMGSHPSFWLYTLATFLLGAILVGAYPAFILSSFNPVKVLKGLIIKSNTNLSLRRVLLSFQFFLSIMLIAATLVVFSQLNFMRKGDLGYKTSQTLVIKLPTGFDSTNASKLNYFKHEVLRAPSVINTVYTSEVPGRAIADRNTVRKSSQDKQNNINTYFISIDHDFLNTYQVPLIGGSGFSPADSSGIYNLYTPGIYGKDMDVKILVNEALAKGLGYKSANEALNQRIIFSFGGGEYYATVKGVVKNFHQRSLKEAYDPILFYYPNYSNTLSWNYASVGVNTNDINKNLSGIESVFKKAFPGKPFESFFLDDFFNSQYKADQRLGNVFGLFASLAIVVACLGLLGLSAFIIKLRTKEIGIRKVLGAQVSSVLLLVSKDFIRLVLLSSLVALPVIYWAANEWLKNYAFHIRLSWFMFVVPPVVLLLLTLTTICLQSIKTAMANPVAALRSE
ncbi:ABC transporter permease [Terrimonas sp.]|uniref:ABC transporter permease n=1 Tax=Terrimonas sp. TaxID=1914338 RepID=UPI000D5245FF|nr:ABC transporter permease [Terrimonas sp.]PVD50664.1 ABC transporter permease [Terrimonas sp.]